jgi:hypothetical protein
VTTHPVPRSADDLALRIEVCAPPGGAADRSHVDGRPTSAITEISTSRWSSTFFDLRAEDRPRATRPNRSTSSSPRRRCCTPWTAGAAGNSALTLERDRPPRPSRARKTARTGHAVQRLRFGDRPTACARSRFAWSPARPAVQLGITGRRPTSVRRAPPARFEIPAPSVCQPAGAADPDGRSPVPRRRR